ncbi:hypothetical protein Ndes2526B_g02791 [Nannochloris sp. 'desiccata']|nr:hypothetical protein KSW81_006941 [Chlorella desiccata (nom. nud.)]
MVSAVHGTLISCDPPLKEIIKSFDAAEEPQNKFIISDLTEGKLFIKSDRVEYLHQKVKQYSDSLHFEVKKDQ